MEYPDRPALVGAAVETQLSSVLRTCTILYYRLPGLFTLEPYISTQRPELGTATPWLYVVVAMDIGLSTQCCAMVEFGWISISGIINHLVGGGNEVVALLITVHCLQVHAPSRLLNSVGDATPLRSKVRSQQQEPPQHSSHETQARQYTM